jgi:hypothetical protein
MHRSGTGGGGVRRQKSSSPSSPSTFSHHRAAGGAIRRTTSVHADRGNTGRSSGVVGGGPRGQHGQHVGGGRRGNRGRRGGGRGGGRRGGGGGMRRVAQTTVGSTAAINETGLVYLPIVANLSAEEQESRRARRLRKLPEGLNQAHGVTGALHATHEVLGVLAVGLYANHKHERGPWRVQQQDASQHGVHGGGGGARGGAASGSGHRRSGGRAGAGKGRGGGGIDGGDGGDERAEDRLDIAMLLSDPVLIECIHMVTTLCGRLLQRLAIANNLKMTEAAANKTSTRLASLNSVNMGGAMSAFGRSMAAVVIKHGSGCGAAVDGSKQVEMERKRVASLASPTSAPATVSHARRQQVEHTRVEMEREGGKLSIMLLNQLGAIVQARVLSVFIDPSVPLIPTHPRSSPGSTTTSSSSTTKGSPSTSSSSVKGGLQWKCVATTTGRNMAECEAQFTTGTIHIDAMKPSCDARTCV